MDLTYLTPSAPWATTAKTFSAPNRKSLISDYNLGKFFTYEAVHYDTLHELAEDMSERVNQFAIYGHPTELTDALGVPVERRTVNFAYGDDHDLHCFDIDGWRVPDELREGVKLSDHTAMSSLINDMLRREGFDMIADATKVITLSSSCWTTEILNCHLYCQFDNPIRIEAMREFAMALAKVYQRKVFDDAVYKAVQPQFFCSPTCEGFVDPLAGRRVFLSKGINQYIYLEEFQNLIHTTLSKAEWSPTTTANSLPPIGKDWLHTIRNFVGEEHGVNQPCFRAAAQLVQSMGRLHVQSNLNTFAQEMFEATWQALTAGDGPRGTTEKDKKTYDLARFRQYLTSATQKNFGDDVDTMVNQIDQALTQAEEGDTSKLTSLPVVRSMAYLKAHHYNRFIEIENRLRRNKVITLTQLGSLIKTTATDAPVDSGGVLMMGSVGENENMLIDTVLSQYEYITDNQGAKFASVPGNGDGGYRMMRVNGGLIDVFYSDGLDMSGNQVSSQFGRKSLSRLLGKESKAIDTTFRLERIGIRVVSEAMSMGAPTWINLGKQTDGLYKSLKLTPEGAEILTHRDSEVMWMHGAPPLYMAGNEQIEARFGENADLMDYLLATLPKFIAPIEGDMDKLLSWLCLTMADKTLSYLLELNGSTGTGKSTAADFLKDLIDPSGKQMGQGQDRTMFRGVTDNFLADIESRYITILDNLSILSPIDQDGLCGVATGLRHSERILYTQTQMERNIKRPLIVTSLAPVVTRPDLRTRVITVELARTKFDAELLTNWNKEKPYLTAALAQLTSKVLAMHLDVRDIPKDINPREIFKACTHSVVHGKSVPDYEVIREALVGEALDALNDVKFIGMLIAYIDEEYAEETEFEVTTRGLHKKLEKWSLRHSGKARGDITVNPAYVPNTGRGLGWELAKNIDSITQVSDWTLVGVDKMTNAKRYKFKRKENKLDSLI